MSSRRKSAEFTLPNALCETADAPVEKHSAACTVELTTAGGSPNDSSRLEAETPYAIPRAPSINCATKPARTNQRKWLSISTPSPNAPEQILDGAARPDAATAQTSGSLLRLR